MISSSLRSPVITRTRTRFGAQICSNRVGQDPQHHQPGSLVVRCRRLCGEVASHEEHRCLVGQQRQDAFGEGESLQQPVTEERVDASHDGLAAGRHRRAQLHIAVNGASVRAQVIQADRLVAGAFQALRQRRHPLW